MLGELGWRHKMRDIGLDMLLEIERASTRFVMGNRLPSENMSL